MKEKGKKSRLYIQSQFPHVAFLPVGSTALQQQQVWTLVSLQGWSRL